MPDKLQLNLDFAQVNLILGALAELPAKHSMGLINEIHAQVSAQAESHQLKEINHG